MYDFETKFDQKVNNDVKWLKLSSWAKKLSMEKIYDF